MYVTRDFQIPTFNLFYKGNKTFSFLNTELHSANILFIGWRTIKITYKEQTIFVNFKMYFWNRDCNNIFKTAV